MPRFNIKAQSLEDYRLAAQRPRAGKNRTRWSTMILQGGTGHERYQIERRLSLSYR